MTRPTDYRLLDPDRAPAEWMPGVFDAPWTDGYPRRHRPVRHQYGDTWYGRCGALCWHFRPVDTVLELCRVCPDCEAAEHADRADTAARAAADLRASGDPSMARAALTLEALASLEARDAQQPCPEPD